MKKLKIILPLIMIGFLSYIMNSVWCLHGDHVDGYLPYVKQLLDGKTTEQKSTDEIETYYAKAHPVPFNSALFPVYEYGNNLHNQDNIPDNSIAIVCFRSVITKYDQMGECSYGPAGTITKEYIIRNLSANPKIKGLICFMDTPGGEGMAPERVAIAIRECEKPVICVVDGLCTSAGYFIAASCDAIVLTSETDLLGSIGTMITAVDIVPKLEKDGYKVVTKYATESTDKNLMWRNAFNGDDTLLIAYLDKFQSFFKASIIQDRGAKLQDKPVFSGKTFSGSEAIKMGLADEMGGINKAIAMIDELTTSNKTIYKF